MEFFVVVLLVIAAVLLFVGIVLWCYAPLLMLLLGMAGVAFLYYPKNKDLLKTQLNITTEGRRLGIAACMALFPLATIAVLTSIAYMEKAEEFLNRKF